MDFLRNYEADEQEEESDDRESNREQTASPTGSSSSSSTTAGSPDRSGHGKPSTTARRTDEKDDKNLQHKSRKDRHENTTII